MSRQERVALHTNQKRMQFISEEPNEKSLVEGKPEYRETDKGLYQYVRYNNDIYSQLLTRHTRTLEEQINDTVNNITIEEITIDGILDVSSGGTGATTLTDHSVLVGSGTSAVTALSVGSNGQILVGSSGADPVFATLTCDDGLSATTGAGTLEIDLDLKSNGGIVIESNEAAVDLGASSITGTLAVGDGGTGITTVATSNILTGNGSSALTAESQLTFDGDVLAITGTGTAKGNKDILTITNDVNAADMDGTATSILFNQWYYDGSSPAVADAGRISVVTVNDWISTTSTQDSNMSFQLAINGTLTEMVEITSDGKVNVTDDLQLTSDASVFNMGDGGHFSITHDGDDGATIASQGELIIDATGSTVAIDGHTGITLDASNSGNVEINVTAADDILIGNDAVAQDILLGNAAATQVDLTAILVDINGGASGVTIDGDLYINSPYAALANGDFDVALGVTDPESDHGRVFGSGFADYYTNYVWVAMWDLQVSAEYDTDFGSW